MKLDSPEVARVGLKRGCNYVLTVSTFRSTYQSPTLKHGGIRMHKRKLYSLIILLCSLLVRAVSGSPCLLPVQQISVPRCTRCVLIDSFHALQLVLMFHVRVWYPAVLRFVSTSMSTSLWTKNCSAYFEFLRYCRSSVSPVWAMNLPMYLDESRSGGEGRITAPGAEYSSASIVRPHLVGFIGFLGARSLAVLSDGDGPLVNPQCS